MIDVITRRGPEHIITVEDPVNSAHLHRRRPFTTRCTATRRTFALALRAAMRQAPKVFLVGKCADRETIDIALTAAGHGHLVFRPSIPSTLRKRSSHLGTFEAGDQQAIRARLAAVVPLFRVAAAVRARSAGASRCSRC